MLGGQRAIGAVGVVAGLLAGGCATVGGGTAAPVSGVRAVVSQPGAFSREIGETFFRAAARGDAGDEALLRAAIAEAEARLETDPGDAEAKAWIGFGLIRMSGFANDAGKPLTAFSLWRDGVGALDEAVKAAPDNPVVRLRRASTFARVAPHYPNKGEATRMWRIAADEGAMATEAFDAPGVDAGWLEAEALWATASALAALGRPDDAAPLFERVTTQWPDTAYADLSAPKPRDHADDG